MSKKLILSGILCLAAAAEAAPQLDASVRDMIAARVDNGELASVVVGLVDGGDSAVFGFGKVGAAAPDAATVYEIGSVSKTFTGLLLAKAVAAGAVTLDTPVAALLPGYTVPTWRERQISLLDLATQSSGLPRLPSNLAPKQADNPYADYDAARLKAFLQGYQLTRQPGKSYEYSNLGVGLLGHALATQAKLSYAELVRQQITAPLGMASTGVALTPALRARLAPGHDADGKPAANWDMDALAGAGALRSSGGDMLLYLQAMMRAGAAAREQSNGSANGAADGAANQPFALAQQAQRRAGEGDVRIGLAWHMNPLRGTPVVWHNGMTGGYASFVGFSADGRRGVVVLSNSAASVDSIGQAALVAGAPVEPKQIALPQQTLADYSGRYALQPGLVLTVRPSAHGLSTQATGQQALAAFASARDEFFLRAIDAQLSFKRDAAGAVHSVVLHQHGQHIAANKLPPEPARPAIRLGAEALRQYVGNYLLEMGLALAITVEGEQLYGQATGQARLPLLVPALDEALYEPADISIRFRRDGQGKVNGLLLRQAGNDVKGELLAPQ